ncbi:hypothetical protein NC653_034677 [Populus alba x Populus x berolinensis]|uniref:Uncharacterized protein n=1 Tax=Populus alba x Populus x berolinensis TaxID=444605 RepID=A0AAD6PWI9_9ROSI|nr:hypothetical protein NC653_034677 [Populus alba x Populus x berolinensis]
MMHGQYLKLSQLSDNFKAITEGNVHVLTSRSLDELEGIRGFNMPLGEDGAVYDTVQPCDTTQVRSNLDFGVKSATVQVYGNNHNSQSDRWIGLIFYVDSPDIFDYLGLKIQVNRSSGRNRNTGQRRLYEFCYLLPFNLWTCYLVRILFLQGCGSWFWEFPNSTRIFNELQYSLQLWQ